MELHGKHFIGRRTVAAGEESFRAVNPATGAQLDPAFDEATEKETDWALAAATQAFDPYRERSPQDRAGFLNQIADEIDAIGDALTERAGEETGLPAARLTGERGRTCGQLRMFAALVREGSWVDACIDRAQPEREPLPKPDVRRMLIPLGPVVVFGASNFPLAFSVAGGDTASALAAGCPVVVKAHPAHPGTCELVARAVLAAAQKTGMPDGVFSLIHGRGHRVGTDLVEHPGAKAVAFTGSLQGGRALFDLAARRPEPIPVYAEMGSINPVFVLPGALSERAEGFADALAQSVTLGVGQFCTNPGLVVGVRSAELEAFTQQLRRAVSDAPAGTMLHRGILEAYECGATRLQATSGVTLLAESSASADADRTEARARAYTTDAETFLHRPDLSEEVFGPSTLVVHCGTREEMESIAQHLEGHLTATVHATEEDLRSHASLIRILETKVGRLVLNGFPTGVEVCPSMHHGGPYPATTDSRSTSVGTAAIARFARPLCYQGWPGASLPPELRNENASGIWRTIDGERTRDGV